tara:strand:+ start:296 stop:475 length:180 start_codon:yes stop_codon:yes gene_type:complete
MSTQNNYQNQKADFEKGIINFSLGMSVGLAAMAFTGNPILGIMAGKAVLLNQQINNRGF